MKRSGVERARGATLSLEWAGQRVGARDKVKLILAIWRRKDAINLGEINSHNSLARDCRRRTSAAPLLQAHSDLGQFAAPANSGRK